MAKEPTYPHVEAALRYARDVVAGRILACKWVILACKRQLDDLERWDGVDGAPYFFDRAAAERVIKFEEMMPHVKGEWARKRMTLKLEPWQKFILSTLFGWKRAKDGLRRFREAYIEVPRKNGKSCFVAPMGLYMLVADGEEGAEVYSGATTEKQAWEVYGPAQIMAKRAEGFMEHYGVDVRAKNMNLIGSASRFEPLIGDPGDGASPHCAIVDEYHEHDSPRLYDTMITGMGARRQPLIIVITTAGFNLGGPCYDMRLRAGKVLDRTLQDEELFAVVYTIDADDDWKSPEALRKAN
ncbi:MAG: terminase large subunit domain-containing protein, partial [Bilophila wadsworthia]